MDYTSAVDPPARTEQTDPRRPSSMRVLLIIGGIVLALCVVFGVTTVRSRSQYQDYKARTIDAGPPPWDAQHFAVADCVRYSIDWGMECPGVASWCGNEAPVLTRRCLDSQDRSDYCTGQGDAVASTQFGYAECEQLRESVEGKYAKRSHKKFCAASYRAVASMCRDADAK